MGEAETKKQNKTLLTWKGRNKKSSFKKNDFQATSICRSFLFRDFSSFHSFLKSNLQYHKIHPFGEQSKEGVENLRGCFGTLSSPPPQVSQCPPSSGPPLTPAPGNMLSVVLPFLEISRGCNHVMCFRLWRALIRVFISFSNVL